jgi:hypothetical protein
MCDDKFKLYRLCTRNLYPKDDLHKSEIKHQQLHLYIGTTTTDVSNRNTGFVNSDATSC